MVAAEAAAKEIEVIVVGVGATPVAAVSQKVTWDREGAFD